MTQKKQRKIRKLACFMVILILILWPERACGVTPTDHRHKVARAKERRTHVAAVILCEINKKAVASSRICETPEKGRACAWSMF